MFAGESSRERLVLRPPRWPEFDLVAGSAVRRTIGRYLFTHSAINNNSFVCLFRDLFIFFIVSGAPCICYGADGLKCGPSIEREPNVCSCSASVYVIFGCGPKQINDYVDP